MLKRVPVPAGLILSLFLHGSALGAGMMFSSVVLPGVPQIDDAPILVTLEEDPSFENVPSSSPVQPIAAEEVAPLLHQPTKGQKEKEAPKKEKVPLPKKIPSKKIKEAPAFSAFSHAPEESPTQQGSPEKESTTEGVSPSSPLGGVNSLPHEQAHALYNPFPRYPEAARRARKEGVVLLRVKIDAQGVPNLIEIVSSSGSDALDHAAQDAVQGWKFIPAKSFGVGISSVLEIPIRFHLEEASK